MYVFDFGAPSWMLDQGYLDLPGRTRAQLSPAYDYHSNVARCTCSTPAISPWKRICGEIAPLIADFLDRLPASQ